jgi:hypothetical protein
MGVTTPERQEEAIKLMREVLGDQYMHLHVNRVAIEEDLERRETAINCEMTDESSGDTFVIERKGVGLIDAFFQGIVDRFASEYPSLKTISFSSFTVQAHLDTKQALSGTDSEGEVTLQIANSEAKLFRFQHISRSVITAAIIVTLLGLEYFVNSERAFVACHHALKDAQARNRSDLVQRYTNSMASLVQNTSYSEVISKIKSELSDRR